MGEKKGTSEFTSRVYILRLMILPISAKREITYCKNFTYGIPRKAKINPVFFFAIYYWIAPL